MQLLTFTTTQLHRGFPAITSRSFNNRTFCASAWMTWGSALMPTTVKRFVTLLTAGQIKDFRARSQSCEVCASECLRLTTTVTWKLSSNLARRTRARMTCQWAGVIASTGAGARVSTAVRSCKPGWAWIRGRAAKAPSEKRVQKSSKQRKTTLKAYIYPCGTCKRLL